MGVAVAEVSKNSSAHVALLVSVMNDKVYFIRRALKENFRGQVVKHISLPHKEVTPALMYRADFMLNHEVGFEYDDTGQEFWIFFGDNLPAMIETENLLKAIWHAERDQTATATKNALAAYLGQKVHIAGPDLVTGKWTSTQLIVKGVKEPNMEKPDELYVLVSTHDQTEFAVYPWHKIEVVE